MNNKMIIIPKKECEQLKLETRQYCTRNMNFCISTSELSEYGFSLEESDDGFTWIKKINYFPLEVVKDHLYLKGKGYQTVIKIVHAREKILKENGYGITSYKLRRMSLIGDVICTGHHPNLNPINGKFCLDSNVYCKPLTIENLSLLEDYFSVANLHTSFYSSMSKEIQKIRRILGYEGM